jgi:hypothetical protein
MKRDQDSTPEAWEKDPLWDLLRQSPTVEPRPSFTDDVVRAARLESASQPWWKRFAVPLGIGGLTAAAATIALLMSIQPPSPDAQIVEVSPPEAPSLEALDEALRTETLVAAADYPADFSDAELVALITY